MCLYTRQREPKIAKHNISVWKDISRQKCSSKYKWIPPICSYAGELEYNKILIPKNLDLDEYVYHLHSEAQLSPFARSEYIVNEGFHSYTNRYYCIENARRAIIPKGSEYYIGCEESRNEIVANKIIVFNSWWSYIKWRLFK